LSKEEEIALSKIIQNQNSVPAEKKQAIDKLVNCNLALVVHLVKKMVGHIPEFLEIISNGNIGLYKAALKYNAAKHQTRFSSYAAEVIRRNIYPARKDRKIIPTISLETSVSENQLLHETIKSEDYDPMIGAMDNGIKNTIEELLKSLPVRQRKIIEYRYGLNNEACLHLSECAKKLGITRERVRQIEEDALKALHDKAKRLGAKDFLYGFRNHHNEFL